MKITSEGKMLFFAMSEKEFMAMSQELKGLVPVDAKVSDYPILGEMTIGAVQAKYTAVFEEVVQELKETYNV